MRTIRGLAIRSVLSLVALVGPLGAQGTIDWSRRPVVLLTMGQGEEVFEKFGHNAIVVWDEARGEPVAYNWGMFDFAQPRFIQRFLSGDTKYWMAPRSLARTIVDYQQLDRTVTAQELALTPSQKTRLLAALDANAREENKYYRYDYYRDNCSTRVRDALDAVTGGALKRAMQAQPGRGSYRWHTRRLLAYSAPLYFGIQLVLGVDADTPLTGWEEAFLPQSLSESVARIELPAAEGMPTRPLASPIDTLFRSNRPGEPVDVAPQLATAAVVGVLVGFVLLGLARAGRAGAAIGVLVWGALCALGGIALLLAWFATRHVFMANNPSVALLNPGWLVALAAAALIPGGGAPRAVRSAMRWLLVIAVVGTAGAVLLGHTGSALEMAALFLPGHAAVTYAADRYRKTAPRPVS
jgi:Domain of unknown function (DUF4105)